MSKKVSLVIPVMNEENNIQPMLEAVSAAMEGWDYEVIFTDDGSSDNTIPNIKKFSDKHVRAVILNKNYGQTTAMAGGIAEAQGEYIVTLDGDLQNDPTDIPEMIKKLEEEDVDVVAGIRAKRKDGFIFRKIPSKIANAMIRKLTGVYLHDYGCTLKVFKKDIAKNLGLYGELHRFIPVLAQLQGARLSEMPVKHHARIHGKSKYGLGRTFKVISDLMLMVFFQKYLQRPMHLFGVTGIGLFMLGGLINIYLLIIKVMGEDIWGRPLLILGITLLLGGIQLITIGIVAELVVRTYFESQNKTTYRIKEIFVGQ
ncbi:MAG: glycosyltransferase [Rickettsiales bacterium]|nr:glycosyltransferase [Rickettsiales bacterium]|tara:strand:- start:251 stop:1189 length:939 start_codon:yes stop_codon:yes gene_type:complete